MHLSIMNNQSAAGVLAEEIRLVFCRRWMGFMIINDIHNYACVDCIFHGLSKLPGGGQKGIFPRIYLSGKVHYQSILSSSKAVIVGH